MLRSARLASAGAANVGEAKATDSRDLRNITMFAPKSSRDASGQASLQVGPAVRNAPRFAFYTFGSTLRNAS